MVVRVSEAFRVLGKCMNSICAQLVCLRRLMTKPSILIFSGMRSLSIPQAILIDSVVLQAP